LPPLAEQGVWVVVVVVAVVEVVEVAEVVEVVVHADDLTGYLKTNIKKVKRRQRLFCPSIPIAK